MATETESSIVRELKDWWVFDKPKHGTWHLAVPNQGGGTGRRLKIWTSAKGGETVSEKKIERERTARWVVRKRKNGEKYWSGWLAMDEERHELDSLHMMAGEFPEGTVITCREPLEDSQQ